MQHVNFVPRGSLSNSLYVLVLYQDARVKNAMPQLTRVISRGSKGLQNAVTAQPQPLPLSATPNEQQHQKTNVFTLPLLNFLHYEIHTRHLLVHASSSSQFSVCDGTGTRRSKTRNRDHYSTLYSQNVTLGMITDSYSEFVIHPASLSTLCPSTNPRNSSLEKFI